MLADLIQEQHRSVHLQKVMQAVSWSHIAKSKLPFKIQAFSSPTQLFSENWDTIPSLLQPGLGLGFGFWEQIMQQKQWKGLRNSQMSVRAMTDIIPQAWGERCPMAKGKGKARPLPLWGQHSISPEMYNYLLLSLISLLCSPAVRMEMRPIETQIKFS